MGYSELLAPLVKAVQQQQQEIAAEADDNVSLKQLIAARQKEIELMKLQIRILAQPHPRRSICPRLSPEILDFRAGRAEKNKTLLRG